jgi:hypothetical protein
VADASVLSNRPDNNFGSSQLRLDAAPTVNSYLRFDLQGLTGTITSATLRLYVQSTSSAGFSAHEVADNSWAEGSITFNNAPAIGTVVNGSGATTADSYVDVDVTSYITGNGLISLALTTTDTALIAAQSREGANPPELIVETISGNPTPTPTATATTSPMPTPVTPTPIPTNTPTIPPPTSTPTPRCDVRFAFEPVAETAFVIITGDEGIEVTVSNLTTGDTLGSGFLTAFEGLACPGFAAILADPPLELDNVGDVLLVMEDGVPDNSDTAIVLPPPTTPTATNTPVPATATNTPTSTNTAVPPTPTNTATPAATATVSPTPGPGGSTFTFTTNDDAIVLSNRPTSNYGAATILGTDDSPEMLSLLKFDVAGLDGSVASATLRVFVTTAVTPFDVAEVADNDWSQGSITYNTAPATGVVINGSGAISGDTWVEVDVTDYISGDGTFSLALLADAAGRNLFDSAEAGNGPELVVVTGP